MSDDVIRPPSYYRARLARLLARLAQMRQSRMSSEHKNDVAAVIESLGENAKSMEPMERNDMEDQNRKVNRFQNNNFNYHTSIFKLKTNCPFKFIHLIGNTVNNSFVSLFICNSKNIFPYFLEILRKVFP